MATTQTHRMTIEEFRALPEGPPFYEFEEGELIPVPSPTIEHQDIVLALASSIQQFVRQEAQGRVFMGVDVYLPDGRVFIPDLGFVSAEKRGLISTLDGKIHGAPDLVVEVVSQDEARDRAHKFRVYYDNGVLWYWLVGATSLVIEEYQATSQGYQCVSTTSAGQPFHPALFAGLVIDLGSLLGIPAGPEGGLS